MKKSALVSFGLLTYSVMLHNAISCPSSKFGRNCDFTCHCRNGESCDVISGRCPRDCAPGWDGDSCQRENIAYNRETRQKDGKESVSQSNHAVDDDVGSCSKTKPAVPGWWSVTLDSVTLVKTIKLMTDDQTNIHGWKVYAGLEDKIFSMTLCTTIRLHGDGAVIHCDTPILSKHVMVVSRTGPVTLCDVAIYACSRSTFGTECDKSCNCADPLEVCDVDTGACSSGCPPGWTGDNCQTGCRSRFGKDCKFRCGNCDNGASCNKTSGVCPDGCQEGWKGVYCREQCDELTYGKNCVKPCGQCSGDGSCDGVTGVCQYGCLAGYRGGKCNQSCVQGTFGENCNFNCSNCADIGCDSKSGICQTGCKNGWEGAFCTQECRNGFYGKNCGELCDNCLEGVCDKKNGTCLTDCAAGFMGENCTQVCDSGTYGLNCSQTCGNCHEGEGRICDPRNGTCIHGCQFAYEMPLCDEVCRPGYYGQGCEKCGMCRASTVCDPYTGNCPDGCGLNFYGERCMQSDPFSDPDGPQLAIFLGFMITIVGGIMTVVTLCLVIVWQREELADISKKPCMKSSLPDDISVREENGILMRELDDEDDDINDVTDL